MGVILFLFIYGFIGVLIGIHTLKKSIDLFFSRGRNFHEALFSTVAFLIVMTFVWPLYVMFLFYLRLTVRLVKLFR